MQDQFRFELKRDEEGGSHNRFEEMESYYKECESRYLKMEEEIKNFQKSQIHRLYEDFMKCIKNQRNNLSNIVKCAEEVGNILETFKREYNSSNSRDMYVFGCFKILQRFKTDEIKDEVINLDYVKMEVIQTAIFVQLLKLRGHQLVFDLFLGWASHDSQVFLSPQASQQIDVPLLDRVSQSKNKYFTVLNQVTYMLAALICIQPVVLLQFARKMPGQEEAYQSLQNSYKDALNPDIESIDYYFHFVEVFFKKCAKILNHTSLYMLSNWLELSYFQMRSASKVYQNEDNQIMKIAISNDSRKYELLFTFVHQKILPKMKQYVNTIQLNPNQDPFFLRILKGNGNSQNYLQLVGQWSSVFQDSFKKIEYRFSQFNSNNLFQEEKILKNGEESKNKEVNNIIRVLIVN